MSQGGILIPGAIGELIDKITILEIKAERIPDAAKVRNVRHELDALLALKTERGFAGAQLDHLTLELKRTNVALWNIEDDIRLCEERGDFGEKFVALARSVYKENDKRAALKRQINVLLDSDIIEEKHYTTAAAPAGVA